MFIARLNKAPTVITPVWSSSSQLNSERNQAIKRALNLPGYVDFDDDCVGNNGFKWISGQDAMCDEAEYQDILNKAAENWPVGTKFINWTGPARNNTYDPVKYGYYLVVGYQTRLDNLVFDHKWVQGKAVYTPKTLLVLNVHSGFLKDGSCGSKLYIKPSFEEPSNYSKLTQEELEKLDKHYQENRDAHDRVQANIGYARQLIDFYHREKTQGFQQAIENCPKSL